MNDEKPLTLDELAEFFQSEIKPEFQKIHGELGIVNNRLDKLEEGQKMLERGQRELKTGLSFVKDEVRGLKAELSDTPSRREFEDLKNQVGSHNIN